MSWIIKYDSLDKDKIRYRLGKTVTIDRDGADIYSFSEALNIICSHMEFHTELVWNIRTTMEEYLGTLETSGSRVQDKSGSTQKSAKNEVPTKRRSKVGVGGRQPRVKEDTLLSNYNSIGRWFFHPQERHKGLTDGVMLRRISIMSRKRTQHLKLDDPFPSLVDEAMPSSPRRPPRYAIQHRDGELYTCFSYCTIWAAQHAVNLLLRGEKFKWKNTHTIITDSGRIIKETSLDEIMDYDMSLNEQKFIMPEPDYGHLAGKPIALMHKRLDEVGILPQESKPRQRGGPMRKAGAGEMTPADLARELNTTPERIRDALRKCKIGKPYVWSKSEAESLIKQIKTKLKK